jgi:hypothetical protein
MLKKGQSLAPLSGMKHSSNGGEWWSKTPVPVFQSGLVLNVEAEVPVNTCLDTVHIIKNFLNSKGLSNLQPLQPFQVILFTPHTMKTSLIALLLAAVATASDVADLKKDTFDSFIKENDLVLAECRPATYLSNSAPANSI